MRPKSYGLEWLDRGDRGQRQWAHDYLQAGGWVGKDSRSSTHEQLLETGEEMEQTRNGQATISKMRAAWRSKKSRALDGERKAYTFKLEADTEKELAKLARINSTNKTDMLKILISNSFTDSSLPRKTTKADKNLIKKTKEQHVAVIKKLKSTTKRRQDELMAYLELAIDLLCQDKILLADISLPPEKITKKQQRDINVLRRQTLKEIKAVLGAEIILLPESFLEIAMRNKNDSETLRARRTPRLAPDK